MHDLLIVCFHAERDIGIYFAEEGPEEAFNDVSDHCVTNIDELYMTLLNTEGLADLNVLHALTSVLNNRIDIMASRMMYRPYAVMTFDFKGLNSIVRAALSDHLLPVEYVFEKLMIPIILQMQLKRGEKYVRQAAVIMEKSFINKGQLPKYLGSTLIMLHRKDLPWQRIYTLSTPDDWYMELLNSCSILLKRDEKSRYTHQTSANEIYSKLLIIWLRTRNWQRVEEILSILASSYRPPERRQGIGYRNFIRTIDWCCYALLELGETKTFIHGLSCFESIADRDKDEVANITGRIVKLGIDVTRLDRKNEKDEILDSLIRMATKPHKKVEIFSTSGVQFTFLAERAGVIQSSRLSMYTRDSLDVGFYLHKVLGKGDKKPFQKKDAASFLKDYITALITSANQSALRLKDIVDKME